MKTKNIFRMLLVAAALLMGANNVKADDSYSYNKDTFAGLSNTSTIRVNCIRTSNDYWQLDLTTGANESPDFTDWNSNTTWSGNQWGSTWGYDSNNHRGFLLDDNHFDLKCSNSTVSKLTASGLKISTKGLTVQSVTIIGGSSSLQEGENTVWNGNHTCDWGNGVTFSNSLFKLASSGNTVRIYGNFSDGWQVEFMYVNNGWQKFDISEWNNANFPDEPNKATANTTTLKSNSNGSYVEFTLTDDILATITAQGIENCVVQGINFTVTDVVIYVASTNVQTYTATAASASNGTISLSATSGITAGTTVTITATPSEGYEVGTVSVTGANSSTVSYTSIGNNQYTFEMPAANVTVTVTFNEIQTQPSGELYDISRSFGNYEYRTYVTPNVIDFSRSVGVEGYYAKEVSGTDVVFYQITGTVEKGVPLLLKKTGSTPQLWKVTDENASGTVPESNLLYPGPATATGNNVYVLVYHNGYVFAETEYQSAEVDNQHAYLDLNSVNSGNARAYSIRFVKGNTTGINDIKAETIDSNVIYDLRGQRVERPTKGIYIINGQKVMIK